MSEILNVLARFAACGVHPVVEGGELYVEADEELQPQDLAIFRQHKAGIIAYLSRQPRLYLDFETASRIDLKVAGSAAYSEHPSTCMLLLCYAISDGPVRTWRPDDPWRPSNPMPDDLRQAIDAGVTVVAHNIEFDCAIWSTQLVKLGWPPLPWKRWSDTATRARHARLPGDLDGAAEALKLTVRKDRASKAHMLKLARTAYIGGIRPSKADIDRLEQYCVGDIEVLRAVDRRVPELGVEDSAVAEMDHEMNARGMPVDVDTARRLIEVRDREDARLVAEIAAVTEGAITSPTQVQRILRYLSEHGVKLPNCTAETLEAWLEENPDRDDIAANVIRIRGEFAHSSGKKLEAILQAASGSGLVRNTFLHHGAHTGRWAGRGAQLQNLPRNKLADAEATLAWLTAETALPDDGPDAKLSIKAQLSGALRGLFKAPDGFVFVACDFGQVESRVLCELAGQEDKLALYRAGQDVYLATAQAIGSDSRELGKIVTLSAGFGASFKVLLRKAKAYGLTLTPAEAADYIRRWRADNMAIVKLWNDLQGAFRYVVESPIGINPIAVGALVIWRDAESARIRLPSGRELIYRNPRLEPRDEFGTNVVADLPGNGRLESVRLWHGQLTENVVQAVACDVLTARMLQLHRQGVPLVATIHDEVVALVSAAESERTLQRMLEVLSSTPDWAPGLPLAAEGFINRRFLKPTKGGERHHPIEADQFVGNDPQAAVRDPTAARADAKVSLGASKRPVAARGPRDRDAAPGLGKPVCDGKTETPAADLSVALSWPKRIENYRVTFGREPYLTYCSDGDRPWVYGVWLQNDYARTPAARAANFYGAYPGDYLKRIRALFLDKHSVLHVCSGMVDLSIMPGDTLDIRPELNPTYCVDAQTMQGVPLETYDLVLVDPPYAEADAAKYGTKMPVRGRVMKALEGLRPGAHVVWLDEKVPASHRAAFVLEAIIALSTSAGHRLRVVSIFRRLSDA